MKDYIDIIRSSEGYKKTLDFYSDFIGFYRWEYKYSVPLEHAEKVRDNLESAGLDVFIGAVVFDLSGRILKDSRAMLVRNKKKR